MTARTLTPAIDATPLPPVRDAAYPSGIAGICTGGWYPVRFSNVTITR